MKKQFWHIFILCLLSSTFFSGCSFVKDESTSTITPNHIQKALSREQFRVTLSLYTDTPFDEQTPIQQIGYGGVYTDTLIRTAKHLLTNNISRLVVTNNEGKNCPVKHIRLHNNQDIALIQTSTLCATGVNKKLSLQETLPNELLYIDSTLKTTGLIQHQTENTLLFQEKLSPGMSGSPLFLNNHAIIGIVTAQTYEGTEAVLLNSSLLRTRPEVQDILGR